MNKDELPPQAALGFIIIAVVVAIISAVVYAITWLFSGGYLPNLALVGLVCTAILTLVLVYTIKYGIDRTDPILHIGISVFVVFLLDVAAISYEIYSRNEQYNAKAGAVSIRLTRRISGEDCEGKHAIIFMIYNGSDQNILKTSFRLVVRHPDWSVENFVADEGEIWTRRIIRPGEVVEFCLTEKILDCERCKEIIQEEAYLLYAEDVEYEFGQVPSYEASSS